MEVEKALKAEKLEKDTLKTDLKVMYNNVIMKLYECLIAIDEIASLQKIAF